jgi:membrane-associated protein
VLASVATWLQHFSGPIVYLLCGGLVFAETGLFLGFFFPGETAALAGGALASLHHANVAIMVLVVAGCGVAGYALGYEIGKLIGPWLVRHRPLRGRSGVRKAEELIARHGGPAVFLGRWVAVVRALVPGIAGMSGMGYRTFAIFNVAGGVAWAVTFVLVGYAAGTAYGTIAARVGLYSLILVGVAALSVGTWLLVRRRRKGAPSR